MSQAYFSDRLNEWNPLCDSILSSIEAQYDYGPFGEVIRATGPMAKLNPFRFSTKYDDDESDFLYYGYRYYNPSTGRWLSRDPAEEDGGFNLNGFVGNDAIDKCDDLGLLELWFQRNRRSFLGLFAGGPWSQPYGYGRGHYIETDTSMSSYINVWSRRAPDGICNSIDGTLPMPNDSGDFSPSAGAFDVIARDCCERGAYSLQFDVHMWVKGTGPQGNALATLLEYGAKQISISTSKGKQVFDSQISVTVNLTCAKTVILQYFPTISFPTTVNTPLHQSDGSAGGEISFLGFTKL